MKNQNNFEENAYVAYQSDRRPRNRMPQSIGVTPSIQLLDQHFSRSMDILPTPSLSEDYQTCSRRHLENHFKTTNETDYQGQRLSLTLGSHILGQPQLNHFEHIRDNDSFISSANVSSSTSQNQSCSTSYETEIFATVVRNSRFLIPAQSLLEEIVNVGGKSVDFSSDESIAQLRRNARQGVVSISMQLQAELYGEGVLSDDVRTRITKLFSLLDKLETKYEQYYRRMEELVSSFEVIAGLGAAKAYTALTLQAMSRHFYSLRESIITYIRLSKQQLFPSGHSQPRVFDQGTRVSLQQPETIRNQRKAWIPTRGLPETSVGILRSWLFEHFLHPYPNDSEKLMLASQTGLTKIQVSNWFINARVRIWKPMIEEMYAEELEDSSMDSNQSENTCTTAKSSSDHADI